MLTIVEQRRSKRFALKLPIAIIRTGPDRISESGLTRNISSGGILFTSSRRLEVGGPIEYVVRLPGSSNCGVQLRCVGKVVRNEMSPGAETPGFDTAATLERYEFERI